MMDKVLMVCLLAAASLTTIAALAALRAACQEETVMNKWKSLVIAVLTVAALGGCANMTAQQKNTAIGAAVGGVAGSVLTGQSGLGTLGGAAIGGYIGSQIKH